MKVIDVRQEPDGGKDKETKLLFDGPGRKLTQLTLRRGAALAAHASPHPVIIECVAGTGTITAGEQEIPLVLGRRVVLDAGEPHGIVAGALLVLILTRCTSAVQPSPHHDGDSP